MTINCANCHKIDECAKRVFKGKIYSNLRYSLKYRTSPAIFGTYTKKIWNICLFEIAVSLKFKFDWASVFYLLNLVTLFWGLGEIPLEGINYWVGNWRMSKDWQDKGEWQSFPKAEENGICNYPKGRGSISAFLELTVQYSWSSKSKRQMVFHRAKRERQLKIISKNIDPYLIDWNTVKSFRQKSSIRLYFSHRNFSSVTSNTHFLVELLPGALIDEIKPPKKSRKRHYIGEHKDPLKKGKNIEVLQWRV